MNDLSALPLSNISLQYFCPVSQSSKSFQVQFTFVQPASRWESSFWKIWKKTCTVAIDTGFLKILNTYYCPSSHQIVKLAVYGMLPKNLHRRTMMQRLHIFPDDVSQVSLVLWADESLDRQTPSHLNHPSLLRTIRVRAHHEMGSTDIILQIQTHKKEWASFNHPSSGAPLQLILMNYFEMNM